ncbi:MAG: hypothetical protein WCY09_09590 [Candidatus Omnitrophota bacterium]
MIITLQKNTKDLLAVVKRMVFLAYNASGGPVGMGIFQALRLNNTTPNEEQVWKCAYNAEDYPLKHTGENEVYCDYVFGNMMKWGCSWDTKTNTITVPNRTFRHDYQAFCGIYPDNAALARAALSSLGITEFYLSSYV